jgi:hypothetical protein
MRSERELEGISRDEFRDALAKGLGRALLYVKTCGLDRVKDLVLYACLHDVSYDAQIEGSRAKWLFGMFVDSPYYLEFREAILAALVVEEEETWVLLQLCGLAREMALIGDSIAEQALFDFVYRRANLRAQQHGDDSIIEDWIGVDELIEVRGIDALVELSRIYGRRVLANPDDWVIDDLQIFTDKPAEIVRVFEEYAKVEESIAVYYQYLIDRQVFMTDEERKSTRQSSPRQRRSISQRLGSANETIIDAARNKEGEYPSIYMTFGIRATPSELETILGLLLTETDEDICLRLLWVFSRKPLPRLADRLFDWADSQYGKLRMAAVAALARISDDRVYQLGRSKLAKRQLTGVDIGTIDLFINNYHSGDAELILAVLNEVEIDREDLFLIGYGILRLSEKQSNLELGLLLNWMYDRTPCSCCREQAVSRLKEYGQMTDRLLAEYPFDSTEWNPS